MRRPDTPALAAAGAVVATLLAAVPVLLGIFALPTARIQLLLGTGVAAAVLVVAVRLRSGVGALAFTVLVLTAFLLPLNSVRLTGWVTWADVTLVLAVGMLQPAAGRLPVRVPRAFPVGMLVLLVAGAVGSLSSPQPVTGLANFARLMVTVAASVVAVLVWRPELDRLAILVRAWLIGNAVNVAAAAAFHPRYPGQRPAGLTTHPNALGLICVLTLGMAFALYAWGGRRDHVLALASMILCVLGTVLSGSRAAILALAVVALVRGVLARAWLALAAAAGVLATAVLSGSRYLPDLGETTALGRLLRPDSTVGTSDEDRLGRLRSSTELFLERPVFGSGFANATDAHNVFLQILVAAGLIGLAGFLLACWPMLAALWRSTATEWRLLALIPIGFLADAMFSNNLWDRYIWLPLALGLYAATRTPGPEDPDRAAPRPATAAVVRTKEYT